MQKFKERTTRLAEQLKDSSSVSYEKLYSDLMPSILANDSLAIETMVQAVVLVLKEPEQNTISSQLKAAKLIKGCADSWNTFLLTRLKQEIIPIFANILHRSIQLQASPTEGNKSRVNNDARIQMDFVRLISECIFIWSKWLSGDKTTLSIYNELQREGIVFPRELRFFQEIDILYSDVEILGSPEHKIHKNQYIFIDNQLFFEQFPCLKQAKILSSNYISRTVTFIGDKLYQVETTKGVHMKKVIEFPEVCILQDKVRYQQLKTCKNNSNYITKVQGVDLLMEWGEHEHGQIQHDYRLICRRGHEKNRQFALYCDSHAQAVKLQNYIHFISATTLLPNLKQTMLQLAKKLKQAAASHYVNKRVLVGGEASTQGSSLRQDDCVDNNAFIDTNIDQFLQEYQQH